MPTFPPLFSMLYYRTFSLSYYDKLICYNKTMSTQTKITYRMLERISYIHRKIKSGCYPNTKLLAFELKSGIATISRDLDYMRDRMYAPIEYDYSQKGYYYTEPFEPSLQHHLSEKDLRVLLSAKVLLSHYKNTPMYEDACSVLDLLSSSAMNGKNAELLNRITVAPTVETTVNQDIWNVIQDALNKNHILQFDYTDRWGKQTEQRKLRPYQLVLDDGVCYLFGFDEVRNAERIFSLVRIRNAVVTDEELELSADFEFSNRLLKLNQEKVRNNRPRVSGERPAPLTSGTHQA